MDVLDALSDKFKELPDGAYKTAIAQKLMGKSAIDMIPMLNLGGEAIRNYRKEAEELGLVVGEKTVEEAEKFDKSVIRIKAALSGLANKLSEEILPYLNEFLKSVVEWFKSGGLQQTVIQMKSSLDLIAQALLLIKKIVVEIVNVVLNMVLLFSKAAWTLMRIATIPLPAWMRVGTSTALEESGRRWYETILKGYAVIGKIENRNGLLPAHNVGDYSIHKPGPKAEPVVANEKIEDFIRDANKAAREFRRSLSRA